jgi:flagellar biosynthesis anti-sigma factor FlgM
MTTPIDGNGGTPLPARIDRAETTRTEAARTETNRACERGTCAARPAAADGVEVSPDAALMREALQAAHETPDIRADKVEAARKALEAGTLGADAGKLAEALLSRMLDERTFDTRA